MTTFLAYYVRDRIACISTDPRYATLFRVILILSSLRWLVWRVHDKNLWLNLHVTPRRWVNFCVGFVFVSMGSSVQASGMPEALRQIFVAVFSALPYNVIWKWEGAKIKDLPTNVRTAAWWPQQELLGHPKLRAFVSHGGLLSLHEAAYHGAPTLVLPVFCDHDGNAAQAGKSFPSLCFLINKNDITYKKVWNWSHDYWLEKMKMNIR